MKKRCIRLHRILSLKLQSTKNWIELNELFINFKFLHNISSKEVLNWTCYLFKCHFVFVFIVVVWSLTRDRMPIYQWHRYYRAIHFITFSTVPRHNLIWNYGALNFYYVSFVMIVCLLLTFYNDELNSIYFFKLYSIRINFPMWFEIYWCVFLYLSSNHHNKNASINRDRERERVGMNNREDAEICREFWFHINWTLWTTSHQME